MYTMQKEHSSCLDTLHLQEELNSTTTADTTTVTVNLHTDQDKTEGLTSCYKLY